MRLRAPERAMTGNPRPSPNLSWMRSGRTLVAWLTIFFPFGLALASIEVAIVSPTGSVAANTAITITASAAVVEDPDMTNRIASVRFQIDGVDEGDPDTIFPFTVEWTPTVPGVYRLNAVATDSQGMEATSDDLFVSALGDLPVTRIVSPVGESRESPFIVRHGTDLFVSLIASGSGSADPPQPDERIERVNLLVDGNIVRVMEDRPFEDSWLVSNAGLLPKLVELTAQAVDVTGATATSNVVYVQILPASAPEAEILNIAEGQIVEANSVIDVAVKASDSDGFVSAVSLLAGGQPVVFEDSGGDDATELFQPPYLFPYSASAIGLVELVAVVTDNSGITARSKPVILRVIPDASPVVEISEPRVGSIIPLNSVISLAAVALDADGDVVEVEFFAGGESVGKDSSHPFEIVYQPDVAGPLDIQALARDDSGNAGVSEVVSVTVEPTPDRPPTVSIVSPSDGELVSRNSLLTVEAAVTAGSSTPVQVEFFGGGHPIGTDTTPPYAVSYPVGKAGTVAFSAVVWDNFGQRSVSPAVTVTVGPPLPKPTPLNDDAVFVEQAFQDLLGRRPTETERSDYLDRLEGGEGRADLILGLLARDEYGDRQNAVVAYKAVFGSWPTRSQLEAALAGSLSAGSGSVTDDHGNTSATATRVGVESETGGVLEFALDRDVFRFDLTTAGVVTLRTTGQTDTVGELRDNADNIIATNDDSVNAGDLFNFFLSEELEAGTYFIEVRGLSLLTTGTYTLIIDGPGGSDGGGDGTGIEDEDLNAFINGLFSSDEYTLRFGELQEMIGIENENNRRVLFRRLFEGRYDLPPTAQQELQGQNRIDALEGAVPFTAALIREDRIHGLDLIFNTPDVSSRDTAAALVLNLLRRRPVAADFAALTPLSLRGQVDFLLAGEEYATRFIPPVLDDGIGGGSSNEGPVNAFTVWASAFGLTGADAGIQGDPDGDGRANIVEYACHTNPTLADGGSDSLGIEGDFLVLRCQRNPDANVAFLAESSTDLANWSSVNVDLNVTGSTVTAMVPVVEGDQYLRLRVALLP